MHSRHEYSIYAEGADARHRLLTALDGHSCVRVATDWKLFVEELAHFRSAAVYIPELNGHHADRLKRLRSDRPLLPIALVTELHPAILKALNAVPECDDILLDSEIENLPDVLQKIAGRSLLLEAAAWIESLEQYPPELVMTLARACRRREPVRKVTKLAEEVLGHNRQSFWELWRKAALPSRAHDFIDWLLIAHAVLLWYPDTADRSIARQLSVHPQSLTAAIRRQFPSLTLTDVATGGKAALLAKLRDLLSRIG